MATYTVYQDIFDEQLGASNEQIKVVIETGDFNGDGLDDIKVSLSVDDISNSGTEDMIGVAFDIGDDSLISSLGLSIDGITTDTNLNNIDSIIGQDAVTGSFGAINIAGGGVDTPYDAAVQFNLGGAADGSVQAASFLLSSATTNLTDIDPNTGKSYLEGILNNTDWYIRLQSTDGGEESAKTAGFIFDINDYQPPTNPDTPAIDVEKYVSIDGGTTWVDADTAAEALNIVEGTNVQFKVVAQNTGNVDLTNVVLSDNLYDLNGAEAGTDVTVDSLTVGSSYTHIYTNAWEAGLSTNTITATSDQGATDSDDGNYFGADPSLSIDKVTNGADGQEILEGSAVTWTYTVANTGNVDISNVDVTDSDSTVAVSYVSGDTDADGVLDTTETWTYEGTGTSVAGAYSNTGTVTGDYTDDNGTTESPTASDDSNYFGADPSLVLDKEASFTPYSPECTKANVGDEITYTFSVTNDGNVAVNDVSIADALITNGSLSITSGVDADNDGDIDTLGAGETATFTATYTVTDADGVAAQVVNTATTTGGYTDDVNNSVNPESSDTETVLVNRPPDAIDNSYVQPKTASSTTGNVITDNTGEGVDSDPDGDPLSIDLANSETTSAFGGTISWNTDGTFTYTPDAGFAGYDQFDYTIVDACGGVDTATVFLEVQSQNQRSIEMDNLTAGLDDLTGMPVADGNVVSGTFDISNASGDPGLQVQIISVDVGYDQKSNPNGKGKWENVDSSTHANQFWVDENADGLLNGGETLLNDLDPSARRFQIRVAFEDQITIGYMSTFNDPTTGDALDVPDPLRVNASAEIYGRDKLFGFSESFNFA